MKRFKITYLMTAKSTETNQKNYNIFRSYDILVQSFHTWFFSRRMLEMLQSSEYVLLPSWRSKILSGVTDSLEFFVQIPSWGNPTFEKSLTMTLSTSSYRFTTLKIWEIYEFQ